MQLNVEGIRLLEAAPALSLGQPGQRQARFKRVTGDPKPTTTVTYIMYINDYVYIYMLYNTHMF